MPRKIKSKKDILRRHKTARKSIKPAKIKFAKKDLAAFKKLILKKKDDILEDIQKISEDTMKKSQKEASGDISGYSYHMADVATDTYDREFSLGLASNERRFLYELDDALKKVEEGTFGICEDCEKLISKTRLKAVPYARLCVKCQEKREKK